VLIRNLRPPAAAPECDKTLSSAEGANRKTRRVADWATRIRWTRELTFGMAHDHQAHDHQAHGNNAHGDLGGSHSPSRFDGAFAVAVALNVFVVLAELGFGYLANSLALMADAAHNFSDVVGLLLAWGAAWLGKSRPTARHTYGYRRASILAALANATLLLVATGGILVEAIGRLHRPEPVSAGIVIWVAAIGIVVNGTAALLFMRDRHRDMNINGAFLHMAADTGISFGVVIAAVLTMWTGWFWFDPVVSFAIAFAVLLSGWELARDATNLALDAVPGGISQDDVRAYLRSLPGVSEVHDLHIWPMSTTETALTAHLVRPGASLDDRLLHDTARELARRFGIGHATLQVEAGPADHACRLADKCPSV
jgi:cobalt-zinc-cadmium efflux system protein